MKMFLFACLVLLSLYSIKLSVAYSQNINIQKSNTDSTYGFYKHDLVFNKGWAYVAMYDYEKDKFVNFRIQGNGRLPHSYLFYSANDRMLYYIPLLNFTDSVQQWTWGNRTSFPAKLDQDKWKYVPKNLMGYRFLGIFTGLGPLTYESYYFDPLTGDIMFVTYLVDDMNEDAPYLGSKLGMTFWLRDSINPFAQHPEVLDTFNIKVPPIVRYFDMVPGDTISFKKGKTVHKDSLR